MKAPISERDIYIRWSKSINYIYNGVIDKKQDTLQKMLLSFSQSQFIVFKIGSIELTDSDME